MLKRVNPLKLPVGITGSLCQLYKMTITDAKDRAKWKKRLRKADPGSKVQALGCNRESRMMIA